MFKFIYRYSGLQYVVEAVQSAIESFILRYRLRVRMVPTSFKVFIWSLGVVSGASGVFVSLSYENVIESNTVVFENVSIVEVAEAKTEVKEKTIEEKIAETFPENPAVMIAIAKAESGMNPLSAHINTNGTRDIGLMQVNSVHGHDDLEMFDVDKNLKAARAVYDKQGITAWSTFNNGSYLKHLK